MWLAFFLKKNLFTLWLTTEYLHFIWLRRLIRVAWCIIHWFATSPKCQIEFDGCRVCWTESAGSTTIGVGVEASVADTGASAGAGAGAEAAVAVIADDDVVFAVPTLFNFADTPCCNNYNTLGWRWPNSINGRNRSHLNTALTVAMYRPIELYTTIPELFSVL